MSSHRENSKDQAHHSLGFLVNRRLVIVVKMKLLLLSVGSQIPAELEIQKIKASIFIVGS